MKRGEKMEHSIKAGLMITSASDYNMEIQDFQFEYMNQQNILTTVQQ